MFRLKSAVMAAKVWNVIHTLRIFCVSTSTEAIPMERNRPIEPRRVSKGSTNNTLILSTVAALAVLNRYLRCIQLQGQREGGHRSDRAGDTASRYDGF